MGEPASDLCIRLSNRPSYIGLEKALFDGVAAIQCLTAERNRLRSHLEAREQERMLLRTTNEELRRQVAVFGDSYVRFAASCVSHLQHAGPGQ
jgi:hypothetical protein